MVLFDVWDVLLVMIGVASIVVTITPFRDKMSPKLQKIVDIPLDALLMLTSLIRRGS